MNSYKIDDIQPEIACDIDLAGSILVGDDQLINIETLKSHFLELKADKLCEYFYNGQ